jgi:hypothetical protein
MNARYIITVESDNLYAEIWVNNVPIGTIAPTENSPFVFPVSEYMVIGSNKIGVMLHAGRVPSRSADPWSTDRRAQAYHGPAKMSLKFAKYAPEEVPFREEPPVLISIDWQGEAVPVPSYQERTVTVKDTFDPLPWAGAQTFTSLDTTLRNSVLDYLSYLHHLLEQHQFDTYIDIGRYSLSFLTKTYGMPLEAMLQQMRSMLQEAAGPTFHLAPLDQQTIDLRLVADGRMIDVNRIDRGYVLTFKKENSDVQTFLPVRIGQLNGKWMMLA